MILSRYAFIGFTEMRTILELAQAEKQSRALSLALTGLVAALLLLAWLAWHLRRARGAAERANAAKSEFLANMSHEIRTPLGGVIGMLALASATPANPVQKDYLQTALSSATTLLTLLNDILDLSRIEARRLDLAPVDFDVRRLVQEIAHLMSPAACSKGLEFQAEVAADVPALVCADPIRIRQVLLNLVGNAVKFTDCGGVQVSTSLANQETMRLRFQVTDSGIGIPASKREIIFEPFRQADGFMVRRYGGTGLGLAISKRLVEMMGGRIDVVSAPGHGSSFTFTVRGRPVSVTAEPSRVVSVAPERPARHLRVLVAEDHHVNQKLIRAMLERDGHEVTMVSSGRGALETVSLGQSFDLVLMDIQMPDMDGFEAAAAIRALPDAGLRAVPIVALTAHALDGYDQRCITAGMNSYLSTLIDTVQLLSLLLDISREEAAVPLSPVHSA
jgi:signal transduction histidine kinase/ActR/RegA family two-component response regulator